MAEVRLIQFTSVVGSSTRNVLLPSQASQAVNELILGDKSV